MEESILDNDTVLTIIVALAITDIIFHDTEHQTL